MDIFKTKQNDTWVAIPALKGTDGTSAGFDTPTATAYALPSGSNPTVSVTASGPDTEKQFAFNFGIPAGSGGTSQVQSDWNQTDTDAVDYIKNKPTKVSDFTNDADYLTADAAYGIFWHQSDWNQTDTDALDYIKNKPNLSLKENTSNKVTSISSSSTDTQYPSAKCVYNAISAASGSSTVTIIGNESTIDVSNMAVGEMRCFVKYLGARGTKTVSFTFGSGKKHGYGPMYYTLLYTRSSSISYTFDNSAYDDARVYQYVIVRLE